MSGANSDIFIDPDSNVGLAIQIYEGIREGILSGRFEPGERLPPTRELAETLRVSRHTVTTAYGRLAAEGYLTGRRGGGTIVTDLRVLEVPHSPNQGQMADVRTIPVDPVYDLRIGRPDPRLFPTVEWKRCVQTAVDQHTATYGDPAGLVDLRLVLARWIARSRGVDAGFRQLVVTSGAQQALYLLTKVCAGPGDVVAMEDPGYVRYREILTASGVEIANVPVDQEGMVVNAIPPETKLVYVTPSHQFPTGVTMSLARRLALLSLAQQHGMVVIEDDYDSEFRYVDRPLEPLHRLDQTGRVAYVASFSKTLSPALRLGFVVVPEFVLSDLLEARHQIDWAPPLVDQLALRRFITDGHLDRHLRKTRRVYRSRFERVTASLERFAKHGWLTPSPSNAGLHVSADLGGGLIESDITTRLAERGVGLVGYGSYSTDSERGGLAFGFGLIADRALDKALAIVEETLQG